MTQEIIEKLHVLEQKRDALKSHLKAFASWQYDDKSILLQPKFKVREGIKWPDGSQEYQPETNLFNQFLPEDILEKYISNAKNRLEEIEKEIEEL